MFSPQSFRRFKKTNTSDAHHLEVHRQSYQRSMNSHGRKRLQTHTNFAENCPDLVAQISELISKAVDGPFTFDQLRTLESLRNLVEELKQCKESFLVFALLWCKLDFAAKSGNDETNIDTARGYACEIAAMRVLRRYDSHDVLIALTNDFIAVKGTDGDALSIDSRVSNDNSRSIDANVSTPLLHVDRVDNESRRKGSLIESEAISSSRERSASDSFTALEVAIVAGAKHFTSAQIVQDILTEIWNGEIVFWTEISQNQRKRAQYYDKAVDAKFWNFARLRVPLYAFIIESFNFFILSGIYLLVVTDREYSNIGWVEVFLALWFIGFSYQELDQFRSAGQAKFYFANPFNYFDLGMIIVAFGWMILRVIGIYEQDKFIVGRSYDVLSLMAVLLVPRLFSFLSLTPYFGTLFPCLRRLIADFIKFLVLVVAIFLGFIVTFAVLGRNDFSVYEITWLLIRIFFGGSGLGFDAMHDLHPLFGAPLMLVFVTFTQILLTTVLISILSNSFSKVMDNARAEYQFLFASTCLEASRNDHMVVLSPPFNLLALILVRPLRLILPSNHWFLQWVKISILKITHAPFVLVFSLYERSYFAPTMSEGHRRRLEKSQPQTPLRRALNMTLGTPTGSKMTPALLTTWSTLTVPPISTNVEDDTDDEEGLDTGVMLDTGSSGMDRETKQRFEAMERQLGEMRDLLELLLAKSPGV